MDKSIAAGGNLWKTAHMGEGHDRAFIEARMLEVYAWCTSADAQTSAKRQLAKSRLPLSVDDLLGDTQAAVLAAIRRKPEKFETFHAPSYCMKTLSNLVKRLWSRRPDVSVVPWDEVSDWLPTAHEPEVSGLGHVETEQFLAIVEAMGDDPVHVSAAITVVYLRAHDDIAIDDAPWPRAGVGPARRDAWPALWLATRDPGLFPRAGRARPDGQARKRQRHLEQINGLLDRAHVYVVRQVMS